MKGLLLHVRPASDDDSSEIEQLSHVDPTLPSEIWVGKLLGQIVCVAVVEREGRDVGIQEIFVARHLRRMRIGRAMVSELERHLLERGVSRLTVPTDCRVAGFFRRIGFREHERFLYRKIDERD